MMLSLRVIASLMVASCSLPVQTVWTMGAPWLDLDQVMRWLHPVTSCV